ncbi:hypothetical protein [Dongshaea marina]|uniref:hypothetical protein n=1 Tax=Dongshaea marina TaxID=2047966 RepID=UPI00131ED409|nr:hypothetical protein [Dongshaea marina]
MKRMLVILLTFLSLSLLCQNAMAEAAAPSAGFFIDGGVGGIYMPSQNTDFLGYNLREESKSAAMASLMFGYTFPRERFESVHYGIGLKTYGVYDGHDGAGFPMPEIEISKYLTDRVRVIANVGTIFWVSDLGMKLGYDFTPRLMGYLGYNYLPVLNLFGGIA